MVRSWQAGDSAASCREPSSLRGARKGRTRTTGGCRTPDETRKGKTSKATRAEEQLLQGSAQVLPWEELIGEGLAGMWAVNLTHKSKESKKMKAKGWEKVQHNNVESHVSRRPFSVQLRNF